MHAWQGLYRCGCSYPLAPYFRPPSKCPDTQPHSSHGNMQALQELASLSPEPLATSVATTPTAPTTTAITASSAKAPAAAQDAQQRAAEQEERLGRAAKAFADSAKHVLKGVSGQGSCRGLLPFEPLLHKHACAPAFGSADDLACITAGADLHNCPLLTCSWRWSAAQPGAGWTPAPAAPAAPQGQPLPPWMRS